MFVLINSSFIWKQLTRLRKNATTKILAPLFSRRSAISSVALDTGPSLGSWSCCTQRGGWTGRGETQSRTLRLGLRGRQEGTGLGELKAAIYRCPFLETFPLAYNMLVSFYCLQIFRFLTTSLTLLYKFMFRNCSLLQHGGFFSWLQAMLFHTR